MEPLWILVEEDAASEADERQCESQKMRGREGTRRGREFWERETITSKPPRFSGSPMKAFPQTWVIAFPLFPHILHLPPPLYTRAISQSTACTKKRCRIMQCRCHPAYQSAGTGAEESAAAFIHNNPSESDREICRPGAMECDRLLSERWISTFAWVESDGAV